MYNCHELNEKYSPAYKLLVYSTVEILNLDGIFMMTSSNGKFPPLLALCVPNRWQTITCTNADTVRWCIYAALGGDQLKRMQKLWKSIPSILIIWKLQICLYIWPDGSLFQNVGRNISKSWNQKEDIWQTIRSNACSWKKCNFDSYFIEISSEWSD